MSPQPARTDPYQIVTDQILRHLERGTVPWRCPWRREIGRPRNFHTGREYQGVNVLLLGLMHFPSPWWLTLRQANALGGSVRKGERGAMVIKWGQQERTANNGDGSEEKKVIHFLRSYHVFNACQIEGIQFPEPATGPILDPAQRIERAESITNGMPNPPRILEGNTTRASYRPSTDTVTMPPFASFDTPEDYHLTLFHELVHSTGHPSRLNRRGATDSDGFGGKIYSQEELVAEMGAAFLGMEADIVRDQHEQSAAYLKGWLDVLKDTDHRRWILQAASQAGRASEFILAKPSFEPEPVEAANGQETGAALALGLN